VINDRSIIIGTKHYHPSCFTCSKCKKPIEGKFFPSDIGGFMCIPCGTEKCGECSQPIMGQRLEAGGIWFHPECFKCALCKKPISGKYSKFRQQILCLSCRDKAQEEEEERARAARMEAARRQEEERRRLEEQREKERLAREQAERERRERYDFNSLL
jgi:hypothetical protein